MSNQDDLKFITVTKDNVEKYGVFCIKNQKAQGFKDKVNWFKTKMNNGIKLIIVIDSQDKQLGFVEYIPSEIAWRPIKATNYYFIQCIALFSKNMRNQGISGNFIQLIENDAKENNKSGGCTMKQWFIGMFFVVITAGVVTGAAAPLLVEMRRLRVSGCSVVLWSRSVTRT